MERARICEALRALRESRPEFVKKSAFRDATGVHPQTIDDVESGRILPGVDTMEKWLRPFDVTVSEFLAQFERSRLRGLDIVAGFEHLYQMLTTIIRKGGPRRIHGITINLEDISAAASPPSLEHGARDSPVKQSGRRRGL